MKTPLHDAAATGNLSQIIKLLQQATDPEEEINTLTDTGWTALHHAARNGHVEVVGYLVDHGADPDKLTCGLCYTPLHLACLNLSGGSEGGGRRMHGVPEEFYVSRQSRMFLPKPPDMCRCPWALRGL